MCNFLFTGKAEQCDKESQKLNVESVYINKYVIEDHTYSKPFTLESPTCEKGVYDELEGEHIDHNYSQLHITTPHLVENCQDPQLTSEKKPNTIQIQKEHNYAYSDTLVLRSLNVCGLKSKISCCEFLESCQMQILIFSSRSQNR